MPAPPGTPPVSPSATQASSDQSPASITAVPTSMPSTALGASNTPAPTSADSWSVSASVSLGGITRDEFLRNIEGFKTVIASGMGTVCGTGSSACTAADVIIKTVQRRAVSVSFSVKVASEGAAGAGTHLLSSYLQGSFSQELKAQGVNSCCRSCGVESLLNPLSWPGGSYAQLSMVTIVSSPASLSPPTAAPTTASAASATTTPQQTAAAGSTASSSATSSSDNTMTLVIVGGISAAIGQCLAMGLFACLAYAYMKSQGKDNAPTDGVHVEMNAPMDSTFLDLQSTDVDLRTSARNESEAAGRHAAHHNAAPVMTAGKVVEKRPQNSLTIMLFLQAHAVPVDNTARQLPNFDLSIGVQSMEPPARFNTTHLQEPPAHLDTTYAQDSTAAGEPAAASVFIQHARVEEELHGTSEGREDGIPVVSNPLLSWNQGMHRTSSQLVASELSVDRGTARDMINHGAVSELQQNPSDNRATTASSISVGVSDIVAIRVPDERAASSTDRDAVLQGLEVSIILLVCIAK